MLPEESGGEEPLIELVGAVDEKSPIVNILKKNGTAAYHLCYEVADLDAAVENLREDGYLPLGAKKPSTIGGRNVIFLFHPDNCLIELVET